jgi:hypothetical protein
MADLKQELGNHAVKVKTVRVSQEDDGATSIGVQVEFKDGERGWKYVNDRTEKGLQFMHKTLKAIGFDPAKNDIAYLVDHPDALMDTECEAVVGENNYRGVITNRIDWLNKLRVPPPAATLSSLSEKLRAMGGDEIPTVVPDQDGAL